MISVRAALSTDIPEMRDVAIQSFVDKFAADNTVANMNKFLAEAYDLNKLYREFEEPDSQIMLAFSDGQLTGFVRLRKNAEADPYLGLNHIELQRLYVLTEFQNQKIGKLLMDHSIEYATSKHFDWIWLGVWEKNFEAQRFYARWGFEKFGEHVFHMGDDPQTDWLLKRKL